MGGGNGLPPSGGNRLPRGGGNRLQGGIVTRDRHQDTPPQPPVGAQLQQGLTVAPTKTEVDRAAPDSPQLAVARTLAETFYRGLGGEVTAVTAAIRRRDLVIARELVAAGATPSEAEAYAVETGAVSGRIAPVDLRSFERERLGWLVRRRRSRCESRSLFDRTGQPPSWQIDVPPIATLSVPEDWDDDLTETTAPRELAGSPLGRALRSVLLTRR
jgi:hypothetical protein